VPVIRVDIPGTTTDGVILYFHGGFFAGGSAAASVGLASDLARKARMPVETVDCRLAPEHPYPAAPDDAMSAYRGLLDSGQDAIYRVEDGLVAEHWDVLQEEVSPTSSGHPMFTVPGRD
jgi:acetyl esterase/lipase